MFTALTQSNQSFSLLRSFQKDPYLFFDRVRPSNSENIKYLKLGIKHFYFCYHPDHARYILQTNSENFPKSRLVLKKILPLSGLQGLIQLSDGEAKPVRQTALGIMQGKHADRLARSVGEFVEDQFDLFDRVAERGESIDLRFFLTQLVLRTAGVFILNQDLGPQAAKLNHSFVELNRLAGEGLRELISFPFSWKRYRHLKVIHRELKKIMALPTQEGRISLSERLRAQGMPERFIRDQVKAFMFAGYDTTASSLIFAMDAITRERSVQDKIYLENREHFRQAHYTQAVYKESLRLYPSAYFLPREIKNDDNILGQSVRAGAQIFLSVKHIQRDSSVFKNPDQFIPERFLDKLPHSHAFIPFGGGARICIGAQLAMLEATVVLQRLCERYIFHSVRSSPPEIEGLITAHTKTPLLVKLSRRKSC